MKILLLQLDGSFPNIALMRIAAHHAGDEVELRYVRKPEDVGLELWDNHDRVYASAIFTKTRPLAEEVLRQYPNVLVGGTGWDMTPLEALGITTLEQDYRIYPHYEASIGFTQRGCRFNCPFCVVRDKEGKNHQVQTVPEIWRGEPYPKHLLLLDNDFFGQPNWRDRLAEMDGYKVSLNQGINARTLTEEEAEALASIHYSDNEFKGRRIYTAWDNTKDEQRFFRGLERLVKYGAKPSHFLVYMLIGYWPGETEDDWDYRRARLREFGAIPYPMPYVRTPVAIEFQRWVVAAYDKKTGPFKPGTTGSREWNESQLPAEPELEMS